MNKVLPVAFVGISALLLVVGFKAPVANAEIRTFCPMVCDVYSTKGGSHFLTPRSGSSRPQPVTLNGVVYTRQNLDEATMESIVRNDCSQTCTIFKIDAGRAIFAYEASTQ